MEQGPKERIFARPLHPYTQALLASTPGMAGIAAAERIVLKGELPSPLESAAGMRLLHALRRTRSTAAATERPVPRPLDGRLVACHSPSSS